MHKQAQSSAHSAAQLSAALSDIRAVAVLKERLSVQQQAESEEV